MPIARWAYAAFTDRIPPLFTVVRLVLEVSDLPPKQSESGESKKEQPKKDDPKAVEANPGATPKSPLQDRSDLFR